MYAEARIIMLPHDSDGPATCPQVVVLFNRLQLPGNLLKRAKSVRRSEVGTQDSLTVTGKHSVNWEEEHLAD